MQPHPPSLPGLAGENRGAGGCPWGQYHLGKATQDVAEEKATVWASGLPPICCGSAKG